LQACGASRSSATTVAQLQQQQQTSTASESPSPTSSAPTSSSSSSSSVAPDLRCRSCEVQPSSCAADAAVGSAQALVSAPRACSIDAAAVAAARTPVSR
jgi:hypothetical protein